jgi:hypothetical protein
LNEFALRVRVLDAWFVNAAGLDGAGEENHPVSRSGCHPPFVRRGIFCIVFFFRVLRVTSWLGFKKRKPRSNEVQAKLRDLSCFVFSFV